MSKSPQLRCSCVHCDQFIDYTYEQIGEIAACPFCGEQSLLPPAPTLAPAPPEENDVVEPGPIRPVRPLRPARLKESQELRRPNYTRIALIIVGLVAVTGGICLLPNLKPHRTAHAVPPIVSKTPPGSLPEPTVKRPKSLNDLTPGTFELQQQRGSDVKVVSGDIQNDSENVHRNLKVELDLHDAQGTKVDSAEVFVTELAPHAIWHVLAKTTNAKAATVRVAGLREEP